MKKIITTIILLLVYALAYSQNTITGAFPGLANQQVKLRGFNGFNNYTIDSVKTNDKGIFNLSYGKIDYGMGYLSTEDNKTFIIILSGESLKLKGEVFALPETIKIIEGGENQLFEQYAQEHPRREQALSAWIYLEKIYRKDSLFVVQEISKQAIAKEKQRIKADDSLFLAGLAPETYVSWYLPLRKLASSVSTITQYRTEEISSAIASFREIDYTDNRLHKSGLLADIIDSHFWLIENSGRSLGSVYIEMNISIDYMIENLLTDEIKLNEISEYLFKLLEKRSLFESSEYLASRLLNEQSCTLNNDFAAQLESYRVMKVGNTAPDFAFIGDILNHNNTGIQKLSDIKTDYTVVVFGASWCPQCPNELSQISLLYQNWKKYNVEVVFISLDENKKTFNSFASIFPFISICDYKKWESSVVKAFHVFATPTIYLLDKERKIILRPSSVQQMNAWVDWYLINK